MKDLLTKLQSFPKTWEMYLLSTKLARKGFYKVLTFSYVSREDQYVSIAFIEKLLLDFCDGEGYYICVSARPSSKFYFEVIRKNDPELYINAGQVFLSRQEAFNQGVIKAFSLMESKGDKNEN